MRFVSSLTPTAAASEELSATPMNTLTSGWTIARKACGKITNRRDWVNVSPMALAASAWPTDTALMPPRMASQTNAAPDRARHSAAEVNSEYVTPTSGSPNTTRISSARSGMLRKNST